MVTLEKFKRALGDKGSRMTDSEILKLKDLQEQLADVFFDVWLEKINNGSPKK